MEDPVQAGPAAKPVSGEREPSVSRIPALDGVRALAIGLVLVFHGGFSWAGGGFFGVDVFFVLSGFLITGLLIGEFRQSSHIGLRRFWIHRIRRLVPALLVMLAGVACYAAFFAPPDTLGQLRSDAIATLLYGNNWHLVNGTQGYFAALNTPRPLLHTWSLSIEEQFYLVWPLVVLAIMKWTRSLRVLLTITIVGALASAGEMAYLYHRGSGINRIYYGTDTRAQALLIGAALAVVLARPAGGHQGGGGASSWKLSLVRRTTLSPAAKWILMAGGAAGLAAIVTMSVAVNSGTGWLYQGGFGLVALAAAAVVASVSLVPDSPWARLLSLRPVRYLGAISYGLYLWHWPVFVVLDNARTGLAGWPLFGVRVAVSVAVAALSYHVVEMPIRRGILRGWRGWAAAPVAIGGAAALLVATTAGAVPALGAQSVSSKSSPPVSVTAHDPGTSANTPQVPAGTGGPYRVLLLGDSEASFLGFGLGPASGTYNVNYAGDGVLGCGLLQGETTLHNVVDPGTTGTRGGQVEVPCATQYARWTADLNAFHPDVVLLADGEYEVRNRLLDGSWTHIGQPGFDRAELNAMRSAVAVLRSTGARVVLLTAVYYQQPEQADGSTWPEDDPQRVDRYNALLRQVAAEAGSGVTVEDLNAHLDPGGHYAQYIDGVNVRYADGIHVDAAGAKLVAPWLLTDAARLAVANRASASASTTPGSSPSS
ncbi:MAG TPA: acyltransferase family protein [Acidimicrobiales bacterium]|nr:acyltransferase family protein [Acidimicrobiales bacterium]